MVATRTHPLVGEIVDGRYRVLRHLADGGMASVLLALDVRLDREVALKVMREDLARDDALVARFRVEARSAARLSHPNVVPVHDQGEDDGLVFLAMEYVEGRTAREVVDAEGAMTPRAALDVLEAVLTGLGAAHDAGFIHRDVKPENVLVPDRGPVKVADFGLARAVTSRSTGGTDGPLLGTVSYLAPEQVDRGTADARSDVYAAGLLLFELLSGTTAVDGDTPIHVAFQHVHDGAPPLSSRVPQVPRSLERLVAAATAIDPDERPADASAYLDLVRETRAGLTREELDTAPVVVVPPGRAGSPRYDTVAHSRPSHTRAMPAGVGAAAEGGDPSRRSPRRLLPRRGGSTARADGPRAPRRRPGRRWLVALLALVLAGSGVGIWWATAGPGSRTTVPEVEGLTTTEAAGRLDAGDLDVVRRTAFDGSVPRGTVISSDPAAGQQVDKGTEVAVTTSRGPEPHIVPDLAGRTTDAASDELGRVDLTVGTVSEEWSDDVPAGQVISSSPAAGERLQRDAAVDLVVSRGDQPVAVPGTVGSSYDDAKAALERAGLTVRRGEDVHSPIAAGSVVSMDPVGGSVLGRGETVTLVVSKGPETATVPDVTGLGEADATRQLEEAGFAVSSERVLGGLLDTVRATWPGDGGTADKGTTVTIFVV